MGHLCPRYFVYFQRLAILFLACCCFPHHSIRVHAWCMGVARDRYALGGGSLVVRLTINSQCFGMRTLSLLQRNGSRRYGFHAAETGLPRGKRNVMWFIAVVLARSRLPRVPCMPPQQFLSMHTYQCLLLSVPRACCRVLFFFLWHF